MVQVEDIDDDSHGNNDSDDSDVPDELKQDFIDELTEEKPTKRCVWLLANSFVLLQCRTWIKCYKILHKCYRTCSYKHVPTQSIAY